MAIGVMAAGGVAGAESPGFWFPVSHTPSPNAPDPNGQESDQDSDPISLQIAPLCPEAIDQALSDLKCPRETKDTERSRRLVSRVHAEQQGNDCRESKQQDMEKEVAGRSPNGHMQPQRLEGRYNKKHDPGRACPTQAIPAHQRTAAGCHARRPLTTPEASSISE